METPICSELNDLDRPFTEEELQEIDAAFESATKRPNNSGDVASGSGHKSSRKSRRRLPESLFVYNQQNEGSSTTPLNRCTRNRSNTSNQGAPTGKAAVMQICGDKVNCYVLHIIHSGIPQTLQSLLEDPTVVKVGVGIANDAYKVYRDHNVFVKTSEDLSELANKKLDDPKKWGLASLTEKLLAKQLPKPSNIRLGNWEANVLSTDQLHYAATDAFVSWYLYQALKSLPEIIDDKK